MNLLDAFNDLNNQTARSGDKKVLRAPFGYPGGKSRSIKHILPLLPYRDIYVEPFGGSGAVLIARNSCKLEVFNDRYAGVIAFYRCIRDGNKLNQLIDRLELSMHAREEFVWCKATWEGCADDVERAARWYCMMRISFGAKGRNWGRATGIEGSLVGAITGKLPLFPRIHERMCNVQIENQDWADCIQDYDDEDAVFYLDPPYLNSDGSMYKNKMLPDDHRRLLDTVMDMSAFVAVSGFPNPLYDSYNWDGAFEWQVTSTIKGLNTGDGNNKGHLRHLETRDKQTERLWIKE